MLHFSTDKFVQQISICENSCNQWQKAFELKPKKKPLHVFMGTNQVGFLEILFINDFVTNIPGFAS
jgi:hypothetical protein